jgi:hypothetical protein
MQAHEADVDWICRSLQASLETSARVIGIVPTSIGTGQVGENVRFELTWDAPGEQLPVSVVGKFPSSSDVSRSAAVQMNTYVKEVGFYRELQPAVTIRTPRVHTVEWDRHTHDFAVLMEDIRPARQGDQLRGCGVTEAELAIDEAVGLHAPTWARPETWAGRDWLGASTADEQIEFRAQLFELLTPGFVDRFASRLAPDVLDLAEPLARAFPAWYAAVGGWADGMGAWCVVHGDYRLDNLLFGEPPSSPGLTVVDWQTVSVGTGPNDIAYFCGAGLLPDVRAEVEHGLVRRYAAGLRAAGVVVTDEAAWDGYVLGSVSGFYMAVLASQVVEQTARGDEMFAVMAERHADQMRTVGLLDRLGVG